MSAHISNHTPEARRRAERGGGASLPFSARNRAYVLTFAAGAWSSLLLMAGATACARLDAPFSPVVTPHWEAPAPQTATLFSATRAVRDLVIAPDGAIWAATEGGVAYWADAAATPRIWTTANGLPSNDVRTLVMEARNDTKSGTITAVFPAGQVRFSPSGPALSDTAPQSNATPAEKAVAASGEMQTAQARTGQTILTATTAGLFVTRGKTRLPIALPAASRASHVSALLALPATSSTKPAVFIAGLHGDGLYRLTVPASEKAAPKWERLAVPDTCKFVTALAALPATANRHAQIVIGTRRDGVFVWNNKTTQPESVTALPLPNAFPSGDIYGVSAFQNRLFVSTFDQGVLEVDTAQTQTPVRRVHADVREGRALVPFGDKLYTLRADHCVWAFDGAAWKPAWPAGTLKRAEVFSLAADERNHRLLVGGWAGWAEWNGHDWQQHWGSPALQNESITAICADAKNDVWLGTQRKGLVRCAGGETYQAFTEANGLPDDWITCLAVSPQGRLLAGTYTGGMVEWKQNRFASVFAVDKWAIRTIVFDNERAFAATPVGVFREGEPINGASPAWQKIPPQTTGGSEAQALFVAPRGLWVGTRSGLTYLPR